MNSRALCALCGVSIAFVLVLFGCSDSLLVTPEHPAIEEATLDLLRTEGDLSALSDPVVSYLFDEGSGRRAYDYGPNGFTGTIRQAVWKGNGNFQGLLFNGTRSAVNVPQAEALDLLGSLPYGTITVRFRYGDKPGGLLLSPLVYFGSGTPRTNHVVIEVGHGKTDARKLYFTTVVNGIIVQCYDTDFDLTPGTWYEFSAVVGPEGNTGYLDGEELIDRHYNFGDASSTEFFASIPATGREYFTLGYGTNLTGTIDEFYSFYGIIDYIHIYDEPLTGEDVRRLVHR